mmetsp:Transcript_17671/g.53163  ORF Transcript_17671/g.53163 Transcript_17671/m.53163 type:complete len:350 (+) Transcript_17671:610-1659(+)
MHVLLGFIGVCLVPEVHEPVPTRHACARLCEHDGVQDLAVLPESLPQHGVRDTVAQVTHIHLAAVRKLVPRPPASSPKPKAFVAGPATTSSHAAAHAARAVAPPAAAAAARRAATERLQEIAVLLLRVFELAAMQPLHVALVLLVDLGLDCVWQLEHLAALVGALVLPVPGAAADEARLLLELLEGSIEGSELAQLDALVLITRLVLRLHQLLQHLRRVVHISLVVAGDKHVQVFVFAVVVARIACSTLLHTASPPDGDLRVCLPLHALLGVATRANDQANEIGAWVLLLRDPHLLPLLGGPVVGGRAVHGVALDHLLHQILSPGAHLLPHPHLPRVLPDTVSVVDRLG